MNRLTEILNHKRQEIDAIRSQRDRFRRMALERDDFRSFATALQGGEGRTLALIAEVKRASPSAGIIAEHFEPVEIARRYEAAGADAISVLTDERFFQGHLDYLQGIREEIDLPLLRKDFTLDEIQIYEAAAAGADAVLLIVAALPEPGELERLLDTAHSCQLDVLVEVHTLEELDRALSTDAQIIGINNRDLSSFRVDLSVTETLSEQVPSGIVLVSESGIRTAADSRRVRACGADAILVGEALMRSGDVATHAAELKLLVRPANDPEPDLDHEFSNGKASFDEE
jgi:indole-3-glycerol phosphate synthase